MPRNVMMDSGIDAMRCVWDLSVIETTSHRPWHFSPDRSSRRSEKRAVVATINPRIGVDGSFRLLHASHGAYTKPSVDLNGLSAVRGRSGRALTSKPRNSGRTGLDK